MIANKPLPIGGKGVMWESKGLFGGHLVVTGWLRPICSSFILRKLK